MKSMKQKAIQLFEDEDDDEVRIDVNIDIIDLIMVNCKQKQLENNKETK